MKKIRVIANNLEFSLSPNMKISEFKIEYHRKNGHPVRDQLIYHQSYLTLPNDTLEKLANGTDTLVLKVKTEQGTCSHGSHIDPDTGHYKCGWC